MKGNSISSIMAAQFTTTGQLTDNCVHLYIPRILGSMTSDDVIEAFQEQKLGKIFCIDMHYKINERNNAYYFAFISMFMYDSTSAYIFLNTLDKMGIARVIYNMDRMQYWEVKKHIDRCERVPPINSAANFFCDDNKEIEKEFDELIRDIERERQEYFMEFATDNPPPIEYPVFANVGYFSPYQEAMRAMKIMDDERFSMCRQLK